MGWPEKAKGKLDGGRGGPPEMVVELVGEDVPGMLGSWAPVSACVEGGPEPRSMKRERNFLSRA